MIEKIVFNGQEFTGGASGIGSGQSWQDVKATRTSNVVYTNSTGKPIQVNISASTTTNQNVRVNNVVIGYTTKEGINTPWNFIVPNGHTYKFSDNSGTTIAYWSELR